MEEERGGTSLFVKIQLQSKQFLVLLRVHMSAAIVVVHLADFTKLPAPLLSPGFLVKCLPYTTSLTHFVHTPFLSTTQTHLPQVRGRGRKRRGNRRSSFEGKRQNKTKQTTKQRDPNASPSLPGWLGFDQFLWTGSSGGRWP